MSIQTLDFPVTQSEFAGLVGISQQSVSDLVQRGVLAPELTAQQWLHAYCTQLREAAAGRGADGRLAFERAELARVARERNEIQLAKDRKEYVSVALLELFCAHVGRSVAGLLEPLPAEIHKLCPALSPDDVQRIQIVVARACDNAVSATLAEFDEPTDTDSADLSLEPGDAAAPDEQ